MNLKQILGLCEHEWEWVDTLTVVDSYGDRVGTKIHMRCSVCGDAKSKTL